MVRLARSLVPAILGASLVLAATSEADAECAQPGTVISWGGLMSVTPRNPTAYVFDPHHRRSDEPPAITATVDGEPIPFTVEKVSANQAFATYRVQLETGTAWQATLEVRHSFRTEAIKHFFRLDPTWTRSKAPVLLSAQRIQDRWTCSHTDVWQLAMSRSRAIAYRVEYASSHEALARDPQVTVFPADMPSAFWNTKRRKSWRIELGHANCFGYTIDRSLVRGRIVARFAALYPDGTTGPFSDPFVLGNELPDPPPAEPEEPEPPAEPEPAEPVVATPIEPPPPAPAPEARAPRASCWRLSLAVLGGAAILTLLLGAALRRRLVPPHN